MRPFLAVLSVIVSFGLVKITYLTFGTAFESLRIQFETITLTLKLSAGWKAIAITSTGNFNLLFDMVVPLIIALVVYAVLSLVTNKDYDRSAM